jgi:hypothetical protein
MDEYLEDASVIWIQQVNVKNGEATGEDIKEQEKVFGQQISVTNFVQKSWYVFCSRK